MDVRRKSLLSVSRETAWVSWLFPARLKMRMGITIFGSTGVTILTHVSIFMWKHPKPDEYKPTILDKFLWSKRIVRPISPLLKGDTARIFMRVTWDCGSHSITNDESAMRIIFEWWELQLTRTCSITRTLWKMKNLAGKKNPARIFRFCKNEVNWFNKLTEHEDERWFS